MPGAIEVRETALRGRLEQMRANDEWHLFQNFVLGLLPHNGYQDVRLSAVRHDLGRDGVAVTPQGERCFVAVSFDASLPKIRHDAARWSEDPNREPAEVMLFACTEGPTEDKVSAWRAEVKAELGLDLRLFAGETVLKTATREGVWRETCARLGITGFRPGYRRIAPYDGRLARQALRARPPEWLRERVPLAQWAELSSELRNRIILGKPGAGKTATLFQQLELAQPGNLLVVERDLREASQIDGLLDDAAGGAVIVFDDLHDNLEGFRSLCLALLARKQDEPEIARRFEQVRLLAAARSQEWRERQAELPLTALHDLDLLDGSELALGALSTDQCARLIDLCREEWELAIEPRLARQAAAATAERDATPLYVLSMLAAARRREDRRLFDEDLAGMPKDVLGWWQRYWRAVPPVQQAILRLLKLFDLATVMASSDLLGLAAASFEIRPHELESGLSALERSLWLSRDPSGVRCLDIQLEAIQLDTVTFDRWDRFVFDSELEARSRLALHNGTGKHYAQARRSRAVSRAEVVAALLSADRHFAAVGTDARHDAGLLTLAANNLSVVRGDLAEMEPTRKGRREWLESAVEAVEEAVRTRRQLGFYGELARSLNNASLRYRDLAEMELTREGRRAWLERAVEAVEESVGLNEAQGNQEDLAMSLANASSVYSDLAGMEATRGGRQGWLERAVEVANESVRLFRELGVQGDLAGALSNASNRYSSLAEIEPTQEGRRARLERAAEVVEESVRLNRALGVQHGLAMSLNNASTVYSDLAGTETTPEGRWVWLERGVEAVEESVQLYRERGVQADLAISLNNASIFYSSLVGEEASREGRWRWLERATAAAEESVRLNRALGVLGNLAMSLGSSARHYRRAAEEVAKPAEARPWLVRSWEAVQEAVTLLREVGERRYFLLSLHDAAVTALLLAGDEEAVDLSELQALCGEGMRLAEALEDEEKADFFLKVERELTSGASAAKSHS